MSFKYKVLIINIIVMSIALGAIGLFMIDKNFDLAIESQIKNAIEENNIVQSAVEYELLDVIGQSSNSSDFKNSIVVAGSQIITNMSVNESSFLIFYDDSLVYSNSENETYPETLLSNTSLGEKNYILIEEDGHHYICVASCNQALSANLNIMNKRDITDVYNLMSEQSNYYRLLLIICLLVCTALMYIICHFLTRPLSKLNKISEAFASGDYDARANITTMDEIGDLANKYNLMAESVSHHVNQLQDMVSRQDQFVADFTHEIKTPLTTIIGYSDMLRSKKLSKEQQFVSASYIFSEGKRLEGMSMKLFDFIYTKNFQLDFKNVHTEILGEKVCKSIIPILTQKQITLEQNFEKCTIQGDIELLCTAFINLLDNARKASKDNSSIIFEGKVVNDEYVITVQDFGIGISQEHISRICDEFYMVDKSRSRKEGGAGIGLSLTSLILSKHKAILDIYSQLNEGTTFSATFDIYDPLPSDKNHESSIEEVDINE